jgi:hypothetical protein
MKVLSVSKLLVLAGSLVACACSGTVDPQSEQRISRAQFGDDWPFTVTEGLLRCDRGTFVVFVANGKTYAINGSAKGAANREGYVDFESIWRPDETPGLKVSISPVIEAGLKLCQK